MNTFTLLFILCIGCTAPPVSEKISTQEQTAMEPASQPKETGISLTSTLSLNEDGTLRNDKLHVSLQNNGSEPVKIIDRMAMGFPEMNDGEVYLLITDKSSGDVVGKRAILYNRKKAGKSDVALLQPGEEISADFSLREWYEFPQGELELQAVYSCDNSSDLDPELLKGEYRSEKIAFTGR